MRLLSTIFLFLLVSSEICAQNRALNSFSSGGAIALPVSAASSGHIGVIGQPLVGFSSGTLQIANLMYAKDLYPPVITFDPATFSITAPGENLINFTATDNDQIVSTKIFYKPIGQVGNFQTSDVTPGPNNAFARPIESNWYDDMGMEYYIEAKDKENTTRHPGGAETHIVAATHLSPQIPAALLSYGRTKNHYRIISVPFENNSSVSETFPELPASDKNKYRLYKYESGEFNEFPSFTTLVRGRGYFLIMSDALSNVTLTMPDMQAPRNSQSDLYKLNLEPGWNLIGNPYTVEINWDDVLNFNNNPVNLGTQLKGWTGSGNYDNIKNLLSYQGAFVWLEGSQPIDIFIPFKNQVRDNSGGRKSEVEKSNSWEIDLTLTDGQDINSRAGFGMNVDAKVIFDRFDDLDPPALDRTLSLQFPHPEHSQKNFVRDIIPPSDTYIWALDVPSVNSNNRTLSWSLSDVMKVHSDVSLYDVAGNVVVDMKNQLHYSFPPSREKFKILYGSWDAFEISPTTVTVLPPYPNPISSDGQAIFSIGLPKTEKEYSVQLEIIDAIGNRIHQRSYFLKQGLHEISLPRKSDFSIHTNEMLFYQLQIEGRSYRGKLIYKP